MDWLNFLPLEKFVVFTLVLCRVSGLVMTAPLYGSKSVPFQVRSLVALALAVLVMPVAWKHQVPWPGSTLSYVVLVASEVLVGACLGIGIEILFSGLYLAGQLIGRSSGELLAEAYDAASDENMPLHSQFLWLLATTVFFALGGHRAVTVGVLDTLEAIPPGSASIPTDLGDVFLALLTQSFSLGIRAAAPVVAALLMATLVVGLIGRTVPQLNIMALGFGLNSMLTYAVLAISLGAAVWVFQSEVQATLEAVLGVLQTTLRPGAM